MDNTIKKNNLILIVILVFLLLAGSFLIAEKANAETIGTVITTNGLNVRTGPSTNDSIKGTLANGETFTVLETVDDYWYKIEYNGGIIGYIHNGKGYANGPFVSVSVVEDYIPDQDFEQMLTDEGFPESYKVELRKLHAAHPNWIFNGVDTGLNWNDVIAKESKVPNNLVHSTAKESWKSREYGAYDWSTGTYQVYDSGGWVAASKSIVEYYMDPRNFINEGNIFLFLQQSYNPVTQTEAGMQTLVANTFLASAFPEKGYDTYSSALIYAAQQSGVNPYVLASMILVEQGTDGRGKSIAGNIEGYEGIYNYFNVRAYASGGYDAVEYGLIYAKGSGSYGRPWNTRLKSIVGGAQVYGSTYINNKQDTLYLKKFNVNNGLSAVATHQYMTNVGGAVSEASNLKKGYNLDTALTFNIPVYRNMPSNKEAMPTTGNNDYFLKSLRVAGYNLLPKFDRYTDNYEVTVPSDTTKVGIDAVASTTGAKVSGDGTVTLTGNATDIKIVVTATSGEKKTYTITVAKEGNTVATLTSSTYEIGKYISGVGFDTPVTTFKSKFICPEGFNIKVISKDGKEITSGNVGTGCTVVLYNSQNSAVKSLPVVIKGDVNGDGKLSTADVLFAQRSIIGTYNLSGVYQNGADINGDGKVSTVDVLFMQRHIIGTYTIMN